MEIDPTTMEVVRDIARRVASVEIPFGKKRSHQRLPGSRRSVHRGEGLDFDGHDIYQPGDDPRTIDWNATAMTAGQKLYVGLFKEEAYLKNTILCDVSPTMNFGSERVSKRVLAAELGACLTRSLGRTHDPVGLITFSQWGLERRVKAGSPQGMMLPIILHILETQHKVRDGEHSGLAKGLQLVPRSPSLVFVISDFINLTESDWDYLKKVGRRHRLVTLFVNDLRERELPKVGWLPMLYTVRDAQGQEREVWVTRGTARKHAARWEERKQTVLARLKDCRASVFSVGTDEGASAIPRLLGFLQAPVLQ